MAMDDPFFEIVNGLDIEIENPHLIQDVTTLDTEEIMTQIFEIEQELFGMGQALHPSNQKSRDLHSMRNALQIELRKRRL